MERSNYIEALALEYDMNAGQLRRKVNQMGSGLLPGETPYTAAEEAEEKRRREKLRRRDTSDKRAQRMLLAWLSAYPAVFLQIRDVVMPDDFMEEGYRKLARMIYDRLDGGQEINPSELTNHFINDEQEYKMISEIFHTGLEESVTKEEKEKILSDLVRKVKSDSLRAAARDASDLAAFQEIVKMQERLGKLHIKL